MPPSDRMLRARGVGAAVLLALALPGCASHPDPAASRSATSGEPVPHLHPAASRSTASEPVLHPGRITTAQRHLEAGGSSYDWRAFDPVSGTGLRVSRGSDGRAFGLRIVKPHGPVVRLTCARDIRCPDGNRDLLHTATLGPGGDEITIASGGHAAEVVGYDGTLRRTIDLDATSTNAGRGRVGGLRWSADGRNLAVATYERARDPEAVISRVWLVDGQDTHVRLVLSLLFNEPFSRGKAQGFESWGAVWGASGWGFSPDGQSLLLDVETGMDSADVVVLHLQPEGAADPVVARTLYHSDRNFDWAGNVAWSPDGARIAVRTAEHIVEISADDGRVLARHPHRSGWLIWTTGDPR